MDTELMSAVQAAQPKFNREICEGLAYHKLKDVANDIHQILQVAAESFPGVEYESYEVCTPIEQYLYMTKKRYGERTFEHAHSDMFMVKLRFKLLGKSHMTQALLLPYIEPGNILTIRNSKFVVSPTLQDNLFSVDNESIFMPITRSKLKFHRQSYYYLANSSDTTADVHYSKLHFTDRSNVPSNRHPLLLNYLFAMHGFTTTFKRFFDTDIIYGTPEEITPERYPCDEWVICQTKNIPPGRKRIELIDIRLAIKRVDHARLDVQSAIAGFFYITDRASENSFIEVSELENTDVWKMSLVFFTWRSLDMAQGISQIESHIESIGQYLDALVVAKLHHEGLDLTTIDGLFAHIIKNFANMAVNTDVADITGKFVQVTNVVMLDVVMMIFQLMFALQKLKGARLTDRNIRYAFATIFRYDQAMKISGGGHAEISSLDSPTDVMCFKTTSMIVPQTRRGAKAKMAEMNNPAFKLHPKRVYVNTTLFTSKSAPAGDGRLNPFINLGPNGEVLEIEEIKPLVANMIELLGN